MDIKHFTIRSFHEGLMKKEFSAVEVAREFFCFIEKEDEKYVRKLRRSSRGYGIKIFENLPIQQLRKYYSHASIYSFKSDICLRRTISYSVIYIR